MMEERSIIQVVGQIMAYDMNGKQWYPAGTSSGLSTVRLLHQLQTNSFRIHGQKINENKEVVLDNEITLKTRFNQANDCFIQWRDTTGFCWGINFRKGSHEGENFLKSVCLVLDMLNQHSNQPQAIQTQQLNSQNPVVNLHQRTIQQQQQQMPPQQHPPQQQHLVHHQVAPIMHQQQPTSQMMAHQIHLIQQTPQMQTSLQPQTQQQPPTAHQPTQLHIQQQQQQQQQQLQQQMMHQQLHQQAQTQTPVQIQNQNQTQLQQSTQPPPVSNIPSPPPPPPAPPAPLLNSNRINGFGAIATQHSPIANNSNGNNITRNGGSPSSSASLANELTKAGNQLRKVSLSRSDSERESECNNNTVSNLKTPRGPILKGNLMDDLKGALAKRSEKRELQLDSDGTNSSNGITDATTLNGDKAQESWLAEIIRKEISKEITKLKAEIIDVIKTELRQR